VSFSGVAHPALRRRRFPPVRARRRRSRPRAARRLRPAGTCLLLAGAARS